jgi:hypothetical protein
MRAKFSIMMAALAVALAGLGCGRPHYIDRWQYEQDRLAHEQRMAKIESAKMTRQEMAQFAEMVAAKVVERLRQELIIQNKAE